MRDSLPPVVDRAGVPPPRNFPDWPPESARPGATPCHQGSARERQARTAPEVLEWKSEQRLAPVLRPLAQRMECQKAETWFPAQVPAPLPDPPRAEQIPRFLCGVVVECGCGYRRPDPPAR